MLGLANPNHLQNPRPPTREIIKLISIKNTGGFDLEWITLRTSPRTLQNVTNLAKFCPPLKTHSQTRSNTSPILLNSVPLSKHTLRHPLIRHQSCQILSPSQDTLSDTQQYVINPVKFCPHLNAGGQVMKMKIKVRRRSIGKSPRCVCLHML